MKLEKIWMVTDPTPVSELADVLWETDVIDLMHWVIGSMAFHNCPTCRKGIETLTLYTEEAEAREDAESRLQKRDVR